MAKRDETPEDRAKRIRDSAEWAAFMDQAAPRPGRVRLEHRTPSQPGDVPGPEPDPETQSQHDLAIAFFKQMTEAEGGGEDQEGRAKEIDRLLRAYHAELAARNDRERRRRALRHGLRLPRDPEYKKRRG